MEQRQLNAESRGQRAEGSSSNYSMSMHSLKPTRLLSEVEVLEATHNQNKSPIGDLGVNGQPKITMNQWLVVKTKTKCEKFVRDRILALGIDAFVPLQKRTAKYNRKVKVYELPLITCYTFVRLDRERRNQVLALPYVQGVLRMNGKDCHVSDQEMLWLHKVSGIDQEVKTEELSMQQGDHVMIAYGQLAGMEGKIVSRRSKHEVIVALESLGMQMVLQVDPAMLVRQ